MGDVKSKVRSNDFHLDYLWMLYEGIARDFVALNR